MNEIQLFAWDSVIVLAGVIVADAPVTTRCEIQ
jgi:hypothetical protein